jgi:hypothetical protein
MLSLPFLVIVQITIIYVEASKQVKLCIDVQSWLAVAHHSLCFMFEQRNL